MIKMFCYIDHVMVSWLERMLDYERKNLKEKKRNMKGKKRKKVKECNLPGLTILNPVILIAPYSATSVSQ